MNLDQYGWNPFVSDCYREFALDGELAGRVTFASNERYRVRIESGEIPARLSGKFRFRTEESDGFPVVGDWVLVDAESQHAAGMIHSLLPRTSRIIRKKPGSVSAEQLLAANVDHAFIMSAPNADFSVSRIERYIAAISQERVRPVVIVNKSDLVQDRSSYLSQISRISDACIPICWISCATGDGLDTLNPFLNQTTIVLLGSSGVGKSSLVNRLVDRDLQRVTETRTWDDKGRHTTTERQMIALGKGAVVIDTPGLREIQLFASDLTVAFSDFEKYACECRFRDCMHLEEPGCRIREAVEKGELDERRWRSYQKLMREQRRLDEQKVIRARREEKHLRKNAPRDRADFRKRRAG